MDFTIRLYCRQALTKKIAPNMDRYTFILESFAKNERKILRSFLLAELYHYFCKLFHSEIYSDQNNYSMEYYVMDSKIIQLLIQSIVETGEYTLEGIAYYTHIPFDVIYDAACGIRNQFSMVLWAKIAHLYMQLKPDVAQILIDQLLEIKNQNYAAFLLLLTDP